MLGFVSVNKYRFKIRSGYIKWRIENCKLEAKHKRRKSKTGFLSENITLQKGVESVEARMPHLLIILLRT